MRVFHGSNSVIEYPNISKSRDNLDFGKGFYITTIEQQAIVWSQRFSRIGAGAVVNVYELNDLLLREKFKGLRFEMYDEQWLDYVIDCRAGSKAYQAFDFVEGGIANDKIFNTIELYFDELIDKMECLKRLKFERPNHQLCLITQQAIDECLFFVTSNPI